MRYMYIRHFSRRMSEQDFLVRVICLGGQGWEGRIKRRRGDEGRERHEGAYSDITHPQISRYSGIEDSNLDPLSTGATDEHERAARISTCHSSSLKLTRARTGTDDTFLLALSFTSTPAVSDDVDDGDGMGFIMELLNATKAAAQPQALDFGISVIIIAAATYTSHSNAKHRPPHANASTDAELRLPHQGPIYELAPGRC